MSGGKITVQKVIPGNLVVNITRTDAVAVVVKNEAGSTISMPDTISASATYVVPVDTSYTISVKRNNVEIANTPDGTRVVELSNDQAFVFAPSPDDLANPALDEIAAVAKTGVYGQVARITSGTITIATVDTYQSTALAATLVAPTSSVALGTTNTFAVKNTSGEARVFRIQASADVSTAATNAVGIRLALNGTSIANSESRGTAVIDQTLELNTTFLVTMQANDEVAMFVANHTGTGTVTLLRGKIVAEAIGTA
jgi:hypothetical protein